MWSFKKLVRAHGVERALELLQEQKGYGEFNANTATWEDRIDTPYDTIHDEINSVIRRPRTPITEVEIEVGWKKESS